MAKIIVHDTDRVAALARLRKAIAAASISGVATNLDFHARVLADAEFAHGGVDTGYLGRYLAAHPLSGV